MKICNETPVTLFIKELRVHLLPWYFFVILLELDICAFDSDQLSTNIDSEDTYGNAFVPDQVVEPSGPMSGVSPAAETMTDNDCTPPDDVNKGEMHLAAQRFKINTYSILLSNLVFLFCTKYKFYLYSYV